MTKKEREYLLHTYRAAALGALAPMLMTSMGSANLEDFQSDIGDAVDLADIMAEAALRKTTPTTERGEED
jgi:hypothetical protein